MSFEFAILDFFYTLHNPVLDALMVFFTGLGDSGIIWIILTVLLLLFKRTRRAGLLMLSALVLEALLCNCLLKPLFQRERPFFYAKDILLLVKAPADYSFPSGHTGASFAAAASLYLAGEKRLFYPSLALAFLIALSRLYLYVHYPTDVLGGLLLGILCAWTCASCFERRRKREGFRVSSS